MIKMRHAFSLMEMMVVLLIVAIIAAASAPMVSKKMSRGAGTGDSPWVFTGLGNSIAYNMSGANNSPAIIGASRYTPGTNGPANPRLVLASSDNDASSSLVFASSNGNYQSHINFNPTSGIVGLTNVAVGPNTVAIGTNQAIQTSGGITTNKAVGIGDGAIFYSSNTTAVGQGAWALSQGATSLGSSAYARDLYSVALGYKADAQGKSGVAVGYGAVTGRTSPMQTEGAIAVGAAALADSKYSIAIGQNATASERNSIAIGSKRVDDTNKTEFLTTARHENSVAIGAGAVTTNANQIVLGDANTTVYIPGHLRVDGNCRLADANHGTWVSLRDYGNSTRGVRKLMASDIDDGDDVRIDGGNSWPEDQYDGLQLSDRRLKNVGKEYKGGLEELKQLEFYHYTFKKDEAKTPRVGVMAQDLQKVFPGAVTKGDDGFLRIRWEDMFYAVINAVKELDTKIANIVNDITSINKKYDEQQKVIESQQELIKELQKQNAEFEKRLKKLEGVNRGK